MTLPLETSRLIVRAFEDRDIEPFSRYRSDPEVARYQSWDTPFTIAQAARFINALKTARLGEPGEWMQLAITRKSDGVLLGDCGFQRLADDSRQAEIGYTLAREYQGQGYGTEAICRLLAYLFTEWDLHRVRANCDPENPASARLLERAGMRHEGRFIESLWFKGHWAGEDWYAILRREWEKGGFEM